MNTPTLAPYWLGFTLWAALVFVRPASASPSPLPPALAQLAEKMRHVKTLQAQMEQEKELMAFGEVMRASGHLAFQRPHQLRLDLNGPGGSRIVFNGDKMMVHYKALNKTEISDLRKDARSKAIADHLFLLLRADPERLAEVYRLELIHQDPVQIRLFPKSDKLAAVLRHVDAKFDARGFVEALELVEANADITRWRFKNPVLNAPLDENLFSITNSNALP